MRRWLVADETKAQQPKLADELEQMPYEPLLPVEKRLIAWSIGLGIAALGLLVWLSSAFFPSGH